MGAEGYSVQTIALNPCHPCRSAAWPGCYPAQNPLEVFQQPARPASAPVDDIIRMAHGFMGVGLILGALIVAKAFHVIVRKGFSNTVKSTPGPSTMLPDVNSRTIQP